MGNERKPITKKDWNDLIDSIEIPKQDRFLIIYADMKDMIKMIIDNGGKEVERHNVGTEVESITFQLTFNYDFKI